MSRAGALLGRWLALALVLPVTSLAIAPAVSLAGPAALSAPSKRAGPADAIALGALDSCLEELNPEIDIGYERIASRCPQLARRLEESGWSSWLPRDWKRTGNDLSPGGLRELREIVARESAIARERFKSPSVADLPAVLDDLAPAHSGRVGWWGRTKEWLRDIFERSEQDSGSDWLTRLVGQNGLSQIVLELTSYAALMLVVLVAIVIVMNELRVSGVATRLRGRFARRPRVTPDATISGDELTWEFVCAAPLAQKPQLLLQMIVARLTEARCLPPARALTVRELTRTARLSDEGDRRRLAQLARISESVRFSNIRVASEELAMAVEDGRVLLERLASGAALVPDSQGRS